MTAPIRTTFAQGQPAPYFTAFDNRRPPHFTAMGQTRERCWHILAGLTIGLALWYLYWRWTASLNPDAMVFSVIVASVETATFIGTLLFFHDIWREADTPALPPPVSRTAAGLDGDGALRVDVFITTYDEALEILHPSIAAAQAMKVPSGVDLRIYLLDDGRRPAVAAAAARAGIGYLTRDTNRGYKAGNLCHALLQTDGDFIVICDADTRLLTGFLENTLGYFHDAKVAWVQTPQWFYDIPEGKGWPQWVTQQLGRGNRWLAAPLRWLSGNDRVGADPFMSDPALFFDVIQRRRNRNGASFCCGAGSIHRREPLYEAALRRQSKDMAKLARKLGIAGKMPSGLLETCKMQPFRFHVSEDIYTSILLHSDTRGGWRSVYHPQPETRMLSPWSMDAWALQKLKYAGGTFDIMLRDNPLFRRGMPWRARLHYAATFWSYLSVLWSPVLLLAPVISLVTGVAPISASPMAFFLHLLPVLLVNEAALVVGCKGHNPNPGRVMALTAMPIQWRALVQVLRGQRPRFPVTPKVPVAGQGLRYVWPNLVMLALMAAAAIWGLVAMALGSEHHRPALIVMNMFWLAWNATAVGRVLIAALWAPPGLAETPPMVEVSTPQRRHRAPGTPTGKTTPHSLKPQQGDCVDDTFTTVA